MYHAEESGGGSTGTGSDEKPVGTTFDEAKFSELIKKERQESVKQALAELREEAAQEYQTQQNMQPQPVQSDFWSEQINPRLQPMQQQVNGAIFRAEAAEDKADFYGGEFWNEEVNDWLTGDDEQELKSERNALRDKVEKLFLKLSREGRALPRKDIALHVLGETLTQNKEKVLASLEKKSSKKKEAELEKAKRAVDIGAGNIINFEPETIHSMSIEDMHEKYGNFTF